MAQLLDVLSRIFNTPALIHELLSPSVLVHSFGLLSAFFPCSSFIFTCPYFSQPHSSFCSMYHSYPLCLNFSCTLIGLCSLGCASCAIFVPLCYSVVGVFFCIPLPLLSLLDTCHSPSTRLISLIRGMVCSGLVSLANSIPHAYQITIQ